MASSEPDHVTTILSITGESNQKLHFLANLSPPVSDPEDIYSVIASLAHCPGGSWKTVYEVDSWLTSMDQSRAGFLFAVSMDGELHSNRTGSWAVTDLECPEGLNAVWAASDSEVFAVGEKGERVHVSGKKIRVTRDDGGRRLNAVHGTSIQHVLAVGDDGIVFQFDGATWKELDSPTNYTLLAVLCLSESESYVAGSDGTVFRYDGSKWMKIDCPDVIITGLAWHGGTLYAAAGADGVFKLGPDGMEKLKDPRLAEVNLYELRTIADLLFGVGDNQVLQFNGSTWWGGPLDL